MLQRKTPLLPRFKNAAGFKRYWRAAPNVLQLSTRDLLRVQIKHVREIPGWATHVAPAVEAPAGAFLGTVNERGQLIKVHQQQRARESLKVKVNQLLLYRPLRQIGSPAFSPVSDGRDVHVVQIGMAIIALAHFAYDGAP